MKLNRAERRLRFLQAVLEARAVLRDSLFGSTRDKLAVYAQARSAADREMGRPLLARRYARELDEACLKEYVARINAPYFGR